MHAPDYSVAYGSKYEQGLDISEIAKKVRQDIKAAVKAGDLPKIKASVRIKRYSGGQSLSIEVKEYAYELRREASDMEKAMYRVESVYSDQRKAVDAALEAIAKAYNFDGSDMASDYFHVNFYVNVNHAR